MGRLNPDNCLTIPHTVDCLQGILSVFHYNYSPTTWPSSRVATLTARKTWPSRLLSSESRTTKAFLTFFCELSELSSLFAQRKRTMKRRILEIPTLHIARQVPC